MPTPAPENTSLIQLLTLLLSSGGVLYLFGRGVYNWWNDRLKAKAAEQGLHTQELQNQLDARRKEKDAEVARQLIEDTARAAARNMLEEQGMQRIRDLETKAKDADTRVQSIMDTQHVRAQAFDILKEQYDRLEKASITQKDQIAVLQKQVSDLQAELQTAIEADGAKAKIIQELRAEIARLQSELNQCLGK